MTGDADNCPIPKQAARLCGRTIGLAKVNARSAYAPGKLDVIINKQWNARSSTD